MNTEPTSYPVPPGFRLVPVEPTEAMLSALHDRILILVDPKAKICSIQNEQEVWSAMLASAPTPPEVGGSSDGETEFKRGIAAMVRAKFAPGPTLEQAARAVVENAQQSYRSRGRDRYIEDSSGELMMLVPHEDWHALEQALSAPEHGEAR